MSEIKIHLNCVIASWEKVVIILYRGTTELFIELYCVYVYKYVYMHVIQIALLLTCNKNIPVFVWRLVYKVKAHCEGFIQLGLFFVCIHEKCQRARVVWLIRSHGTHVGKRDVTKIRESGYLSLQHEPLCEAGHKVVAIVQWSRTQMDCEQRRNYWISFSLLIEISFSACELSAKKRNFLLGSEMRFRHIWQ